MVILGRILSSHAHYHTIVIICVYVKLVFDHKEVLFKSMNYLCS